MDYDKLNCGRILKTHFRRALDMCRLDLLESEVAILEDHYQSAQDDRCVDYLRYNDDIESIFAIKHLEKTPTREVHLFHPPDEINMNVLVTDKDEILQTCLQRLADRVRLSLVLSFVLDNSCSN